MQVVEKGLILLWVDVVAAECAAVVECVAAAVVWAADFPAEAGELAVAVVDLRAYVRLHRV